VQYCTGDTQKNGAVSKVNKFISHPTQAQHTLSAAGTVQVSNALPAVHFSWFFDMFYIQWHCLVKGIYGINKL
jgi:hypothetical protein